MLNIKSTALMALSALLLSTAPGIAAPGDYLSLNVGRYDAVRDKFPATQFGAEYRFSEWMYGIHPIVGAFMTSDRAAYAYGGFNWNVTLLPNQLYLVPNFAVGAYHEGDRDARQLGGALEFRSGIELDYQFENAHQLGLVLNHISNAGIYDRNPGEESILVTYSIPVGSIARWVSGAN